MVTITMTTTMMRRRTTWLIAEDPEICLLVVRSPVLLFKTLVETPQTPRTSSRTFSQRRRRTFSHLYIAWPLHSLGLGARN